MSPRNGGTGDGRDTGYALVCALCEGRLESYHRTPARADLAADDHAREHHPDESGVVILQATESQLQRGGEHLLAEALAAQEELGGPEG